MRRMNGACCMNRTNKKLIPCVTSQILMSKTLFQKALRKRLIGSGSKAGRTLKTYFLKRKKRIKRNILRLMQRHWQSRLSKCGRSLTSLWILISQRAQRIKLIA